VRTFVVVGRTATATPDFLLDDLPGTSGRLDVLVRCIRAALLVSHGVRRDVVVYLVLGGSRIVRIDGATAQFLRPDERSLAVTVKKALATGESKRGVSVADGGIDVVLAELGGATLWILDEGAPDIRGTALASTDNAFFVGDHLGFDEPSRKAILAAGAQPVGLGPVSVHSEDAIAIVSNELDRCQASRADTP
jgi:tRNA (pseudouridine54-N1)-methyltransferase